MNRRTLFLAAMAFAGSLLLSCTKDDQTNNPIPDPEEPDTPEQVEDTYSPPLPEFDFDVFPTGGGVYTDTEIRLTFSSAPTLGSSGAINIYTKDGRLVDYIYLEDINPDKPQITTSSRYSTQMDALTANPGGSKYYRIVYYDPVTVEGNSVVIRPHCDVLDFQTEYYITIDESAIQADGFTGIGREEWRFYTKVAPTSTEITVGKTGDKDFRTIQGALNFACTFGQSTEVTIDIANGTYNEPLFLRSKDNLTLRGQSRDGVVLEYANCETMVNGVGGSVNSRPSRNGAISRTGGRAVILMESCDNIRFENMTLRNSWDGTRSQAEVIYFNDNDGTRRLIMVNCRLSSRQDTINTKGYNWFYNCLVEGNVDFIWGSPETVLFEDCEIRTISDSGYSRAYIVQCRCLSPSDVGFVFLNCDITAGDGVGDGTIYLARSSGSADYYDNVSYINCSMENVAAAGWYSSPAPNPLASAASGVQGWKEYGSTAPGGSALDVSSRYAGSRQLSQSDYSSLFRDRNTVFADCSRGTDWLSAD